MSDVTYEDEYTQIANLTRLRTAEEILHKVLPNSGIDGKALGDIRRQIKQWIIDIENARAAHIASED